MLTYATGASIEAGDWVRMDGATGVVGRVSDVLNTLEQARSLGLEGRGVVVDAPPKGLVFLSEPCLRDEPLHFVRRGPGETVRLALAMALGTTVLVFLPVLYSLFSAIYHAVTTGQVTVISLGRTHTHRELVAWPQGWARFVGPVCVMMAWRFHDGSRGSTARWWISGAWAVGGLILLGFSAWFSSVSGAAAFLLLAGAVALAAVIDRKLGRAAFLLYLFACVLLFLWRVMVARGA